MADTDFHDILKTIKIRSIEKTLTPLIQQVSENKFLYFIVMAHVWIVRGDEAEKKGEILLIQYRCVWKMKLKKR